MRKPTISKMLLAALGALALGACDTDDWGPDELREGRSNAEAKALARGRKGYAMYCAGCHGDKGDGKGPAAKFFDPKPRDFSVGRLKFASVPANSLPRDDDYLNVMRHGLRGTAMPSWEFIPADEQRDIVAYIKTFFKGWQTEERTAPLAIPVDPWVKTPAAGVAEGEKLYHGMAACFNCHPAYVTKPRIVDHSASYKMTITEFRDRLYESIPKESDWGADIRPPDFLVDRVKFAQNKDEIAQVIGTGVGGTAMPSWGATLNAEQLWGLAYYVDSLMVKRGTPAAQAMRRALLEQPPYTPPPPPAAEPEAPAPAAPAAPEKPAKPAQPTKKEP